MAKSLRGSQMLRGPSAGMMYMVYVTPSQKCGNATTNAEVPSCGVGWNTQHITPCRTETQSSFILCRIHGVFGSTRWVVPCEPAAV